MPKLKTLSGKEVIQIFLSLGAQLFGDVRPFSLPLFATEATDFRVTTKRREEAPRLAARTEKGKENFWFLLPRPKGADEARRLVLARIGLVKSSDFVQETHVFRIRPKKILNNVNFGFGYVCQNRPEFLPLPLIMI